jgi:hypothetical protein
MGSEREVTQEERDSAKRMSEAVNLHVHAILAEGSGRERPAYVAIKLADGKSPDGTLYDTRQDAARHNKWNDNIGFIRVGREIMSEREALIMLQMLRMARARGVIFSEEEVIVPQLTELMQPFIPRTLRGLDYN